MSSILAADPARGVLARLYSGAEERDAQAKRHLPISDVPLGTQQMADLLKDAPLAITSEVGELLYALALTKRPSRVVEFGASLGASTIYLAAAIHDSGTGTVITTEVQPEKARVTGQNLADAGLGDLVDIRVGDALATLKELPGSVDFLFLDGWNDLYLPVLQLVSPHLAPAALVVADYSKDDPKLIPYQEHVRDPANGYFSITLPLDDGVELSVKTSRR
jgi:predicted O-methyltransferase YrrM